MAEVQGDEPESSLPKRATDKSPQSRHRPSAQRNMEVKVLDQYRLEELARPKMKSVGARMEEVTENVIHDETIWKEVVNSERKSNRKWQERWGFLEEYDQLGRPKKRLVLPESTSLFTGVKAPLTTSKQLGSRQNEQSSRELINLDRRLFVKAKQRNDEDVLLNDSQ